jgi:hypothetical protein
MQICWEKQINAAVVSHEHSVESYFSFYRSISNRTCSKLFKQNTLLMNEGISSSHNKMRILKFEI